MNTFHIPLDQKMPIKYDKIESRLTQLFYVFPLVIPSENSNKNTYHSSQIWFDKT